MEKAKTIFDRFRNEVLTKKPTAKRNAISSFSPSAIAQRKAVADKAVRRKAIAANKEKDDAMMIAAIRKATVNKTHAFDQLQTDLNSREFGFPTTVDAPVNGKPFEITAAQEKFDADTRSAQMEKDKFEIEQIGKIEQIFESQKIQYAAEFRNEEADAIERSKISIRHNEKKEADVFLDQQDDHALLVAIGTKLGLTSSDF